MTDHLIIDAGQVPPVIRCTHCGGWRLLNLPIPIRQLVAIERDWRAQHQRCKPQPRGGRLSRLDRDPRKPEFPPPRVIREDFLP